MTKCKKLTGGQGAGSRYAEAIAIGVGLGC